MTRGRIAPGLMTLHRSEGKGEHHAISRHIRLVKGRSTVNQEDRKPAPEVRLLVRESPEGRNLHIGETLSGTVPRRGVFR